VCRAHCWTYSLSTLATITGDYSRQIRRLSPKPATVAEFGDYSRHCGQATVAVFGDSRWIRLCEVRYFPGPAFSSPCDLVVYFPGLANSRGEIWSVIFQVLQFPGLRFGPSFSRCCNFQSLFFCGPTFSGPANLAPPKFFRVMTRLSLGTCLPNWKLVPLDILELLAFNAQKFTESRDPGHAPFLKKFSGVITGLSLEACLPNLKFLSLIILKLFAFNAQKFQGSRDPGHTPFRKKFSEVIKRWFGFVRWVVPTVV